MKHFHFFLLRNRAWLPGAIVIGAALLAPLISPHDPLHIDLASRLSPPSLRFPLGTDQLGRCILSRTLYGARLSLLAGLSATGLSLLTGLIIGLTSGLAGRIPDQIMMRVTDAVLAFPMMILAVAATGIIGPSLWGTVMGISLGGWAWWARFIRGLTLSAMQKPFIASGQTAGINKFRLVRRYLLPQMAPEVMAAASLNAGGMIVMVSALSFLGLGVQPPQPEWGAMLKESRLFFIRAPWMMLAPGAGISLSVLSFNMMGESIRNRSEKMPAFL